jgi:hypothetical protein
MAALKGIKPSTMPRSLLLKISRLRKFYVEIVTLDPEEIN